MVLFAAWPLFDPAETAFWQQLDGALRHHGLRLLLASTSTPPADLGIAHIDVPFTDAYWSTTQAEPPIAPGDVGLDLDVLLAREEAWGYPSILPAIEAYRRRALALAIGHWFRTVTTLNPAVVVLWNGQHVSEMILDAVSRSCDIPVLYVERAPIAQALFADEGGVSAASAVAHLPDWPTPEAAWQTRASRVIAGLAGGGETWWEQPRSRHVDRATLRRQLEIPESARVLLFAGQVDEDTQRFLFSPHFDKNLSAFAWLLDQLRGRDDLFVLGKHHPKSRGRPEEYQHALAASGVAGAWRVDVSLQDALTVADRCAAVNSTVLYEALALGLPVLSLGDWLLSGRGVAHELRDPARGREVVDAWLIGADADLRQRRWREAMAFLLSHSIYRYAPADEADGMLGARDLAARIHDCAARAPERPALAFETRVAAYAFGLPRWQPPDRKSAEDVARWRYVYGVREQILSARDAASRGQRVVIWGAGAAGRFVADRLARLGVTIDAFVSSTPDRPDIAGRPLIGPSDLRIVPKDLVLVASLAAQELVPILLARGFQQGVDFHVLDCQFLAEQGATALADDPMGAPSRYNDLPTETRISRTRQLMGRQASDVERWLDSRNLNPNWDMRAARAAALIPAGARVLDLGAGRQVLRDLLATGCRYVPADLMARTPDVIVVDVNRGEFPPGRYDVVTALGLFEYVHDISDLLVKMRQAATAALVSYSIDCGEPREDRLKCGWVNALTRQAFAETLRTAGWAIVAEQILWAFPSGGEQWLFHLHGLPAASSDDAAAR